MNYSDSKFINDLKFAEDLEAQFGSPLDKSCIQSFHKIIQTDEAEKFPVEQIKFLDNIRFDSEFIPSDLGGNFTNLHRFCLALRPLTRRDLSQAIIKAHVFLGALPIWIGGTDVQKKRIADKIKSHELLALALTEKEIGSDIARTQMSAIKQKNNWTISGEKWLINSATVASGLTLLTKTNPQAGPLGLSLFFLDKPQVNKESFDHLKKIKTLGIRSADISGIKISNAILGADALVGIEGRGLELTFKTLLASRVVAAELACGPIETLLRMTLEFSATRNLYGKSVKSIPVVASQLSRIQSQLVMAEALIQMTICRAQQDMNSLNLMSPTVKFFVPLLCEKLAQELARIMGARYYLREDFYSGIPQKILRDLPLISLFDGSSRVNLNLVASMLKSTALLHVNHLQPLSASEIIRHGKFSSENFDFSKISLGMSQPELLTGSLRNLDQWNDVLELSIAKKIQESFIDFEKRNLEDEFDPQSHNGFSRAEAFGWYAAIAGLLWLKKAHPELVSAEVVQLAVSIGLENLSIGHDIGREEIAQWEKQVLEDLNQRLHLNLSLGLWQTQMHQAWRAADS